MTLVKCPNGHYYDSSRFGNNCPHCGMSGAASIGADQTTVPLNIPDAPQPANEVTEPLTASQPVVSQPANVTAPTVSDDDRTLPVRRYVGRYGRKAGTCGRLAGLHRRCK